LAIEIVSALMRLVRAEQLKPAKDAALDLFHRLGVGAYAANPFLAPSSRFATASRPTTPRTSRSPRCCERASSRMTDCSLHLTASRPGHPRRRLKAVILDNK
jgi:hypothetical protein